MDLTLVRREGTTETLLSPDDVLELWGGTGGAGMDRLGWIGVRCNLRGSRPRIGARETEFRFDWWSESHGYHIALRVNDEGFQRWGGALRSTLESIEWQ
jgi:hypothetical protein